MRRQSDLSPSRDELRGQELCIHFTEILVRSSAFLLSWWTDRLILSMCFGMGLRG
jgi:hypothetical protein